MGSSFKRQKNITVLIAFIERVNESNCKPKNYGLIKEENFTINLCMNS